MAEISCGNEKHPDGPWHPAESMAASWEWKKRLVHWFRRKCWGCDCPRVGPKREWSAHFPGKVLAVETIQAREIATDDLISIITTLRQHAFLSPEDEAQRLSYLLWQADIVKKV